MESVNPPELVVVGRRHFYSYDGELYPSVSTVLKAYPKPALITWAATLTAEYAVAKRAQVFAVAKSDESPGGKYKYLGGPATAGEVAAVELLKGARFKKLGAAATRGTDAHAVIASGGTPSEEAQPYVDQWDLWTDQNDVQIVAQECVVVSTEYGYGGTVDLVCDFSSRRWVIDLKTRLDTRVFPDALLQAAAYASADVGLPEGVDAAGILTVTPSGHKLHIVDDIAEALVTFRALMRIAAWEGMLEPRENQWGG